MDSQRRSIRRPSFGLIDDIAAAGEMHGDAVATWSLKMSGFVVTVRHDRLAQVSGTEATAQEKENTWAGTPARVGDDGGSTY
jgi:hypothetical protein